MPVAAGLTPHRCRLFPATAFRTQRPGRETAAPFWREPGFFLAGHRDRGSGSGLPADVSDSARGARTGRFALSRSGAHAGRFRMAGLSPDRLAVGVARRAGGNHSFLRAGAWRIWRHADARREHSRKDCDDSHRHLLCGGSGRYAQRHCLVRGRPDHLSRATERPLLLDARAGASALGPPVTMTLEVHIEKKLAEFALDLSFSADDAPLGILGPSGAGKTMLLRCIAGLEHPSRGSLVLGGKTLLDTQRGIRLPARKRRIGMLFQHYALFPHQSVRKNIAFSLTSLPAAERERRVRLMLERVHGVELKERYPRQLSGGEQQRVALARALANEPQA